MELLTLSNNSYRELYYEHCESTASITVQTAATLYGK
jgi:hypothetical protein